MTDPEPPAKSPACPICGKARTERFRPFCSARCQQVDLGRWFTGRYAIEGDAEGEDGSEVS
jgi:endogenous inhibitor of DNA gyrase (YacG/DUF329 family)